MTSGDLPTAAEYGANVLVIVLNDGAFGQTWMQQSTIYGHTYGTSFRSPDFSQIARACGAEGIRVSDPKNLVDALRQALAVTKVKPALVEVMVSRQPYPRL
jgi:thiamine pyrophosphate-dependent acetolactate synthase large subunit-like protein